MNVTLKLHTKEAQEKLTRTVVYHLNAAAASMETIARELSPVDTGYMKAHIRQSQIATPEKMQSAVESGADYSLYVEYGTVKMDAQPFMTPAFESAKKQLSMVKGVF